MSEGEITTYTGIQFDPLHPDPETIRIQDIAHALSLLCRGNGHVKTFYSVGQHCLAAAKEAAARGNSRQVILGALLHDATECYLSDVPHPYKVNMPRYRELEDRLLQAVLDRFLGGPLTPEEWGGSGTDRPGPEVQRPASSHGPSGKSGTGRDPAAAGGLPGAALCRSGTGVSGLVPELSGRK